MAPIRRSRVRRPKDKPKAELSVLLAQRWILAVLRHRVFFGLSELNEAIWELLDRLNERKLQGFDVSRRDLFEQLDRPLLLPLPAQRYELGEWSSPRVSIDYRIEVEKNYYSVPHVLVREKVEARLTASAMVDGFHEQIQSAGYVELSFEERLGMLVDAEWTAREQRRLTRRLQTAKLRYPASFEDIDFKAPRGLDRQVVLALGSGRWIEEHQNLIVSGPTGTGKSFLACALAERACRRGFTAIYLRTSRLLQALAVARGDGSYGRLLAKLAKVELLALDDWLIASLKDAERRDLLEVLEDRYDRGSTLIATQLPINAWHEAIGEPTLADAICDRLLHRAHRIELKGASLRKTKPMEKENGEEAKRKSAPKKSG